MELTGNLQLEKRAKPTLAKHVWHAGAIAGILIVGLLAFNAKKEAALYQLSGLPLEMQVKTALYKVRYAFQGNSATAAAITSTSGSNKISIATSPEAVSIPVLTYHRIVSSNDDLANITVSNFWDQMSTLKRAGWHTVTLQEFEDFMQNKRTLPQKSFLITFDDGAKESYYPVDPILRTLGFSAAMYIIVDASETPKSTYYLSPDEIKRMLNTGRWQIGSHSYDGHRQYSTSADGAPGVFFADRLWLTAPNRLELPEEFTQRVQSDLLRARGELSDKYNVPINTFAFPLGNETGVNGAANFGDGTSITEAEAKKLYSIGFLQTNDQNYTFTFPEASPENATRFPQALASNFIVRRIHVDHDWDGAQLLSLMENGLPKALPYEDDFEAQHGWISSWGSLESGRNNLVLKATDDLTSASTFLDGSELWDDYSSNASINWTGGYVYALADVTNSKTYDACVFSQGKVEIQKVINGKSQTLSEVRNASVQHGDLKTIGIKVHGNVVECLWNFGSVAESYSRAGSGGIGFQVWDPTPATASVQISSVIVRSNGK